MNGKQMAEDVLAAMRELLQRSFAPVLARLKAIEARAPVNGADGKNGLPGRDGKPGLSAFDLAVAGGFKGSDAEWLAQLRGEPGADGADGKDGRDGSDGNDAKDGRDGKDGERGLQGLPGADGLNGKDGAAAKDGRDGVDGDSAFDLALAAGFVGDLGAWLKSLRGADGNDGKPGEHGLDGVGKDGRDGESGKDGEPGVPGIHGRDGADGRSAFQIAQSLGFKGTEVDWVASLSGLDGKQGRDGQHGKDGVDGKDGRDGYDGRDAVAIEIVEPDERRTYPRGTYAHWRGGLIRAARTTEPLAGLPDEDGPEKRGWQIVVCGFLAKFVVEAAEDGRTFTIRAQATSGKAAVAQFSVPTMIDRGVFKAGESYARGDAVSYGGSLWIAQRAPTGKPGDDDSGFRLAVKHGRDGKDGKPGDPGPPGKEGRPGHDLTQMNGTGAKW